MAVQQPDTEELVRRADAGDHSALLRLLASHRGRLKKMIAVRMDPRLIRRLDASDVVQDALAEAALKLPDYFRRQPLPFYPWLRQFAWNRLVDLHRRHVLAQKRRVSAERLPEPALPDQSAVELAGRLLASGTSPSGQAIRQETRDRVRRALTELLARDREVLVLRYLEQLSIGEIAAVLDVNEGTVSMRQVRALERLRDLLDDAYGEDQR